MTTEAAAPMKPIEEWAQTLVITTRCLESTALPGAFRNAVTEIRDESYAAGLESGLNAAAGVCNAESTHAPGAAHVLARCVNKITRLKEEG